MNQSDIIKYACVAAGAIVLTYTAYIYFTKEEEEKKVPDNKEDEVAKQQDKIKKLMGESIKK